MISILIIVDTWALGIVLYTLTTLEPPFKVAYLYNLFLRQKSIIKIRVRTKTLFNLISKTQSLLIYLKILAKNSKNFYLNY